MHAIANLQHHSSAFRSPKMSFSLISFTTVGYGEVVPPVEWRILAGFIAVDGFMLFGLNTAFIFEVLRRMRDTSGSE